MGMPADRQRTISFNLKAGQMQAVADLRAKLGVRTGEVIRRACQAIAKETLIENPAPRYDVHLTVSLPKDLRRKIESLADSCDMKISDVVRVACEAYSEKQLAGPGS